MKHHARLIGLSCIAACLCAACGSDATQAPAERPTFKFPLQVTAKSVTDEPIPGVPVLLILDGMDNEAKTIGYTDKDGKFEALIDANHKTPVAVSLTPPEGYTFAKGKDILDEVLLVKPDDKDGALVHANTLILDATYKNKDVEHLVWVKLECPKPELCKDIPIKLEGEIVATTDLEGRAHFVVIDAPDKTVRITIDTTVAISDEDVMQLEPVNPGFNLKLPAEPQLFTINEKLSEMEPEPEAKVEPKKKKRSTKKKSTKKRSTKKKSTKKKGSGLTFGSKKKSTKKKVTKKKKTEKTGNGISLF